MEPNVSQASELYASLPQDELEAFNKLSSLVGDDSPYVEAEWIDYKYGEDKESRNTWSKALSGFANSGGGILIWGIQTKPKDGFDVPTSLSLVTEPAQLAGKLETWKGTVVDPPVRGVQIRTMRQADGKGLVVAYIPESLHRPHQSKAEAWHGQYFIRIGHQTVPMPQSLLRNQFYPQFHPELELTHILTGSNDGTNFEVLLHLKNTGRSTVSELFCHFMTDKDSSPLVFQPNSGNFKTQTHDSRAAALAANKSIHPFLLLAVGKISLNIRSKVGFAVYGKDMQPFFWKIEGTSSGGTFRFEAV